MPELRADGQVAQKIMLFPIGYDSNLQKEAGYRVIFAVSMVKKCENF
jgi:hypothetical protein